MNSRLRGILILLLFSVVIVSMGMSAFQTSAATPIPPAIPTSHLPPTPTEVPTTETPVPLTETPIPPTATTEVPTEVSTTPPPAATTETPTEVTQTPAATEDSTGGTDTTPTLTPTTPAAQTDSIIMSYRFGASEADIAALVASVQGVELKRIPQLRRILVRVPKTFASPAAARSAISRNKVSAVAYGGIVELNTKKHAFVNPTDPLYPQQVDLPQINLPQAWDMSTTRGSGITVAVLDSGINASHPDLAGRIVSGYNFAYGGTNTSDDYGHGTHVAGTIAALANNGKGVAGIAPNAKILSVKVLDFDGSGDDIMISQGIIFAADKGAKVINMSLGGPGYSTTLEAAVQYANAKGVTVIVAAGNNGTVVTPWDITVPGQEIYPAKLPEVITVGSIAVTGGVAKHSYFSNIGKVDIVAPGEDILSTCLVGGFTDNVGNPCNAASPYFKIDGTSMATPHVAAAAALILSAGVATTPDQVKAALACGANSLGYNNAGFSTPAYDPVYYGKGLLQLDRSLNWNLNNPTCKVVLPNDDVRLAKVATKAPYIDTVAIDGINSTIATDDPTPTCGGTPAQTIWYKFTPTAAGPYQFNTFGSSYNTVVSVYKGDPGSLVEVGCNDDYPGVVANGQSDLSVDLVASQAYYIMVSTKGSAANSAILHFSINAGILATTKVEDSAVNMSYIGTWSSVSNAKQSGTVAHTDADNAMLAFTIRGWGFTLARNVGPSEGSLEIYVNGNLATTLNNTGASIQYQVPQLIPFGAPATLTTAQVVIRRQALGPVGPIDLDWVQAWNGTTIPPLTSITGAVDDKDARLQYVPVTPGVWTESAPAVIPGNSAYLNTLKSSSDPTATLYFKFTGSSATIFRSMGPSASYGQMNISVDGIAYGGPVSNVSYDDPALHVSVPFVISGLSASEHIVAVSNTAGGHTLAIDEIKIASPADLTAGTKADDTNANILYSGIWTSSKPGAPAFLSTVKSTSDFMGAFATFSFTGTNFVLGYQASPTGGPVSIYIDNSLYDTLNTNNATPAYMLYNTSNTGNNGKLLTLAKHFVKVVPSGTPGTSFTLDSVQPLKYGTLKASNGYVTETNAAFVYTGTWSTFTWPLVNGGSDKITTQEGSSIDFWINGTGFIFYGDTSPNTFRGSWDIFVDGVAYATAPTVPTDLIEPVNDPGGNFTGAYEALYEYTEFDWYFGRPIAFGVINLGGGVHHITLIAHTNIVYTDPVNLPTDTPPGSTFALNSVTFDGVKVFP